MFDDMQNARKIMSKLHGKLTVRMFQICHSVLGTGDYLWKGEGNFFFPKFLKLKTPAIKEQKFNDDPPAY